MEAFAELIQKAAGILGVEAARLWPKVVFVYWVQNIGWMVSTPLAWLLAVLGCRRLVAKFRARYDEAAYDDGILICLGIVIGLLGVLAAILTLIMVFDGPRALAAILEPEGAYVKSLLTK